MNKTVKRFLFLCVTICILASFFLLVACNNNCDPPPYDPNEIRYERLEIENVRYQFYGNGVELLEIIVNEYGDKPVPYNVLLDKLGDYDITSISDEVFQGMVFHNIKFGAAVENIGKKAFAEESSRWIRTPEPTVVIFNNRLKRIGSEAFLGRDILRLTIPASVTNIENRAFVGCTRLLLNMEIEQTRSQYNPYNFASGWDSGVPLIQWARQAPMCYEDGYFRFKDATQKELLGYIGQFSFGSTPDEVDPETGLTFSYSRVLVIPESVEIVGRGAFPAIRINQRCLDYVWIPKTVLIVDAYAFSGVEQIYCEVESMPNEWHSYWRSGSPYMPLWDREKPIGSVE